MHSEEYRRIPMIITQLWFRSLVLPGSNSLHETMLTMLSSMSPYGITGPQWVKSSTVWHSKIDFHYNFQNRHTISSLRWAMRRLFQVLFFNSFWPRNIICWHISVSALAQVMAWCLMAPSHKPMLTYPWGSVASTGEQFDNDLPSSYFI